MDALRGLIMLGIGILAYMDLLNVTGVLIAAFLASMCSVFFNPAVNTLMIDIIPHDDMIRGQSIVSSVSSLINLIGKAISGALVAFLGVPFIIVFNGVSYLFSAFTELFIYVPKTKRQNERVTLNGVLNDFKIAIQEIFKNKFCHR